MVVAGRLRATSQQLLEALYLPADVRVMRCICRLATVFGSDSIPLTQTDVASMTGVTRSTANRLLRQAQADGVVAIGRVHLEVLDAPALRKRAELRDR
jgi:CRP-like cAMP-binding protein